MIEARFPKLETALKFHSKLIERYGGSYGLRDLGALESAPAAAQNRYFYQSAKEYSIHSGELGWR